MKCIWIAWMIPALLVCDGNAAVVVYENDFLNPTFLWIGNVQQNQGHAFDPTLSAADQPNANIAHAMSYDASRQSGGSGTPIGNGFNPSSGLRIIRESSTFDYTSPAGMPISVFPATVLAEGAVVGPGANFRQGAATAINGMFLDQPIRLLGQQPTVGIRITLADGFHYGLIQFDWRANPADDGGFVWMYQPIRWAYETEPNVPIVVPAPAGAVPLLTLGILASRRRRSS